MDSQTLYSDSSAARVVGRAAHPTGARRGSESQELRELEFLSMMDAYTPFPGIARGDEIASVLHRHVDQPISVVARWIVSRSVVCFNWRSDTFIPLFQFDVRNMRVRPEASAVLRELVGVFSDWEIAFWFTQPNMWLSSRVPALVLVTEPQAVHRAARADRFIAKG